MENQKVKDKLDTALNHFNDSLNSLKKFDQLIAKRNNWITSASIGLLGYFFAILIQFKMNSTIPNLTFAIAIIVYLSTGIIYGMIYKFRYEKHKIKSNSIDIILPSLKAIDIIIKENPPKDEELQKKAQEIENIIRASNEDPLTGKINNIPDYYHRQLYFFILAIVFMIIYFGFYIFS